MRGLKERDLSAILDFIYHGEANVYQEDLDDFLSLAAELQLKGLDGSKQENKEHIQNPNKLTIPKQEASVHANFTVNKINEKLSHNSSMTSSN